MIAVAPTASAQSGTAKGTLSVDGNKVVLSDRAPDAKSFAQDTRVGAGEAMVPGIISGAWKSQHFAQRFSGYTFTSTDAGKVIDEEIFIGGKNKTFSIGSDEYVLEITSKGPRLAGRIRTKTPVVDVGRKVNLDATFDAPLAVIGK